MTGKKKIWIIVFFLLILASGAAAYFGYTAFTRPLDPSLQLNLQKPPAPAPLKNESSAIFPELSAAPQAVDPAVIEAAPMHALSPTAPAAAAKEFPGKVAQLIELSIGEEEKDAEEPFMGSSNCGFSDALIILFLGTDERQEYPYGADAIRFLKVDYSDLTVACVDLSRDLWVKTPALADKKIKEARLGDVFDIVQTGTKGTLKEQYLAATTAMAQIIYDNFGVAPDRYMTVPQSSFADLVDGLGGIEVEVPYDVDAYKHVVLAGKRNLTGQEALSYIRQVDVIGLGDLGRNIRQVPYVKAVLQRMGEPANLVKLPGLIGRLRENFVTDLSPARIASLGCMLSQVPRDNITFHALRFDMTSPGPQASLRPDTAKIKPWIQELLKK
ncbi:MAG: LCP family protein [Deltaproteobacteria bacterium]|nr:LCP family protein [Deltaproteobacteria bacterium]